jgi:gamma-glutamyltranspeptidase
LLTFLDIFCLFYDAKAKKVRGINGSGRAPKALSLEYLRSQGITGDAVCRIARHPSEAKPQLCTAK